MITLSAYPEQGENRKYLAINNPLLHKFQADGKGGGAYYSYSYNLIASGTVDGKQVELSGNRVGTIRPGDVILINNTTIRNVVSVEYGSGSNKTFVFIDTFIAFSLGGTIKSLNNYRGEFRIFHGKKDINQMGDLINRQVGVNFEITPDSTGLIEFDAQPFLKSFVDFRTLIDIVKKNTVDRGVWGRFYIQYRERWEGDNKSSETGWATTGTRWWVSAVRQLRTFSGVSMLPEINSDPFATGSPEPLGQFLTAFAEPEYYVGYPNEISFGWPEYSDFAFLTFKEETLNPSKVVTATVTTEMLNEGRQEINRVKIGNYPDAKYVRLSINTTVDPSESYVEPSYVQELYVETI
jgi:hypothetical protein